MITDRGHKRALKVVAVNPNKLAGSAARRAIAFDKISRCRATACLILREGGPNAKRRATNARDLARAILCQLKQEAMDARLAREALTVDL